MSQEADKLGLGGIAAQAAGEYTKLLKDRLKAESEQEKLEATTTIEQAEAGNVDTKIANENKKAISDQISAQLDIDKKRKDASLRDSKELRDAETAQSNATQQFYNLDNGEETTGKRVQQPDGSWRWQTLDGKPLDQAEWSQLTPKQRELGVDSLKVSEYITPSARLEVARENVQIQNQLDVSNRLLDIYENMDADNVVLEGGARNLADIEGFIKNVTSTVKAAGNRYNVRTLTSAGDYLRQE